jgi:hypothetical protein
MDIEDKTVKRSGLDMINNHLIKTHSSRNMQTTTIIALTTSSFSKPTIVYTPIMLLVEAKQFGRIDIT